MSLLDEVGGAFSDLGDLAASATLTRVVPGTYNTSTGQNATGSTTTCTCKAVLDASSSVTLGFKFGEGLVQAGDIMALIPAKGLTFTPAAGDDIAVAGQTFTVVANRPTYGGATLLLHNLLVRL